MPNRIATRLAACAAMPTTDTKAWLYDCERRGLSGQAYCEHAVNCEAYQRGLSDGAFLRRLDALEEKGLDNEKVLP